MAKRVKAEKECPREAMKAVRADVRVYMEGANPMGLDHLGDYPQDMATARRTIIALQDLLETSMDRHSKASDHIRDLIQTQEHDHAQFSTQIFATVMANKINMRTIEMMGLTIKEREEMLGAMEQELDETRDELHDAYQQLQQMQSDQGAVMQTLRLAMKE